MNMKRILLSTIILLSSILCYAQSELWGFTYYGGTFDLGGVIKLDANGVLTEVKELSVPVDNIPTNENGLIHASNGKIYATVGHIEYDGWLDGGAIVETDPVTDQVTVAYSFKGASIYDLQSNLVEYNGLLYGFCERGGTHGFGGLFSFDPASNGVNILLEFDSTNSRLNTEFELSPSGKIYYVANPPLGSETIFSYDVNSNTITPEYVYAQNNGSHWQNLTYVNGVLYSECTTGGANGHGYIYSWDAINGYQIRADINNPVHGTIIYDALVYDTTRSVFYATSSNQGPNGAGTLIEYDPVLDTIIVLHSYDSNDPIAGGRPNGQPTLIGDHLYVQTSEGNNGTWHRYHIPSGTIDSLGPIDNYSNTYCLGQGVQVGDYIVFYTDNNVDGYGEGGFVKIHLPTSMVTDYHRFGYAPYGDNVNGVVQELVRHKLFYSSDVGGLDNEGVIGYYHVLEDSFHVVANLNYNKTSNYSIGKWTNGGNGLFYNTAYNGNSTDGGALFSVNPVTDEFNFIEQFDYSPGKAGYPTGSMVRANNGLLYGVYWDYDIGNGQVYSFNPANNMITGQHLLNASIGGPDFGLTGNGSDTLYGVTRRNGSNNVGCIYMYDIANDTAIVLYDFLNSPTTGYEPVTELTLMADGRFMGVCRSGMKVFVFDPVTNVVTFIQQPLDAFMPTVGTPTLHSNGKVYFTHAHYLSNQAGAVFEFDPVQDTVTVFNQISGTGPNLYSFNYMSLAEYTPCVPTASTISDTACVSYVSPSGKVWTMTGIYMDTIPNMDQCDSVITIDLTIGSDTTYMFLAESCDSYVFGGKTYLNSTIDTLRYLTQLGCDSTVILNLTINKASITIDTILSPTTCGGADGMMVFSGGHVGGGYFLSNATTGTVTPPYSSDTINGLIAENYEFIFIDSNACQTSMDSFKIDFGVVNRNDTMSACDSIVWIDGNTYSISGDYNYLQVVSGACDTLVNLNLTINNVDTSVTEAGLTLTATGSGTYVWLDCNNGFSPIAGETGMSFTATDSGDYAVEITENGCVDTSSCFVINVGGVQNHLTHSIYVYPNPTREMLFISSDNWSGELELYNSLGVLVRTITIDLFDQKVLNMSSLPNGIYLLKSNDDLIRREVLKIH